MCVYVYIFNNTYILQIEENKEIIEKKSKKKWKEKNKSYLFPPPFKMHFNQKDFIFRKDSKHFPIDNRSNNTQQQNNKLQLIFEVTSIFEP